MRNLLCPVIALALLALPLSGCGQDPGKACTKFCEDVRDKLIEQMPDIEPEEVQCDRAPWTKAGSCEECKQILIDLFDVYATSEDCNGHF